VCVRERGRKREAERERGRREAERGVKHLKGSQARDRSFKAWSFRIARERGGTEREREREERG